MREQRAKNTSVGLRNDGSLRVNYVHPSLKGLKGKDYHRLYKRIYRQMKSKMLCDCGRRAVGVFGKEPICDVCFQAEGRGHTQDWRKRKGRPVRKESMGNSSGAFYEPPTNEIGHGSLALLEKQLAAIRPLGEGDKDALQILANG